MKITDYKRDFRNRDFVVTDKRNDYRRSFSNLKMQTDKERRLRRVVVRVKLE